MAASACLEPPPISARSVRSVTYPGNQIDAGCHLPLPDREGGGMLDSVREGAMMGAKTCCVLVVLLLLTPAVAMAGSPEGNSAYERGDYATAMVEWQSVAKSGDATASYGIGQIYRLGKGVRYRDFEKAV